MIEQWSEIVVGTQQETQDTGDQRARMAISRQVLGKVSSFLRQEGRSIWGEKLEKQYLLITEKRFWRIQRDGIKGDQWRWGWE